MTGTPAYSGSFSVAGCSSNQLIGGGYAFPRTANYHVNFAGSFSGTQSYITSMDGAPPSPGDTNARGYAQCLAHP